MSQTVHLSNKRKTLSLNRRIGSAASASGTKLAPDIWRVRREEGECIDEHAQWSLRPRPVRQCTPRQRYESELQVAPDDAGFEVGILIDLSRLAVSRKHERHRAKRYHRQVRRQSRYMVAVSEGIGVCAASSARPMRAEAGKCCLARSQVSRSVLCGKAASFGLVYRIGRKSSYDCCQSMTSLESQTTANRCLAQRRAVALTCTRARQVTGILYSHSAT